LPSVGPGVNGMNCVTSTKPSLEMNTRPQKRYWLTASIILGILATSPARAVPQAGNATSASNPRLVKSVTTSSVFQSAEGSDPFFPKPIPPPPPSSPKDGLWGLKLQGISGHGNARLAIINNRTFAASEDGWVTRGTQKVRIRCLQIQVGSVLVETLDPVSRGELRFPPGH
jgi:hypothetical protein